MSERLRIVLDARATTPHFPGVSRAILGLLAGLSEIEHAHQIAVLSWNEFPPDQAVFRNPRLTRVPVAAAPLGVAQQWTLPLLSRSLRPDLWHAPFYVRPFAGIPRPIVTIYDVIGRVVPDALPSMRSRLFFELALRLSLRGAAQVITCSAATKRDLIAEYRVQAERISVIPLAADHSFAPPSAAAIRALRERYALPMRYLLYFGSNKPHKNQTTLVQAFAQLQSDVPLVIAGAWDRRFEEPKRMVAQLGLHDRVRFIHDLPAADVPALLGGALAFVFPSRYEGFGLPPLEAMQCGTPVIVGAVSALPEVVGDAGLLVAPEAAPLAEAIQRLVDDPALRSVLAERGLERARRFSWAETARQTIAVYAQRAARS